MNDSLDNSRRLLEVSAPSRLHFGLFSFGRGHAFQFGGVGLMIEPPMTRLRFVEAPVLQIDGPDARRLDQVVEQWQDLRAAFLNEPRALPVRITHVEGPPAHVGLGSGTQLALAVAIGLDHWFHIPNKLTPRDVSRLGRARRSAVGTYGFFQGGLIIEPGKRDGEVVSGLEDRLVLPEAWRVVLVCPPAQPGPSGPLEDELFRRLPDVEPCAAHDLKHLVRTVMAPAARAGDFHGFCRAVYEFGFRSGSFYGPLQDGPFNGPEVQETVRAIRSLGIEGVGQSSWGPCVFAFCETDAQAQDLVAALQNSFADQNYWLEIAAANRVGHSVLDSRIPQSSRQPLPTRPV